MKRVALSPVALALALGLSLIGAATCDDEEGIIDVFPPECIFMPLDVGNWWEYKVTEDRMFSPADIYKVKFEITGVHHDYKGRQAYAITVRKDGNPQFELIASAYDDACYLERNDIWTYLIQDSITKGAWTQTGLVVDFPLQCIGGRRYGVPAGNFDCLVLYLENASEHKPEWWRECYAENVGLVEYVNYYKEYDTSTPPRLVDWRSVKYELNAYVVPAPSAA